MNPFTFNGDWEIQLQLDRFLESNARWAEHRGKKSTPRPITLRIHDRKDFEPDPLDEQLATVDYILNNEDEVLLSLSAALDIINQKYAEYTGEDDWFPKNVDPGNAGTIFYISEVDVFIENRDGQAYFQLSGEYAGDYEHGLKIAFHGKRLIDFDQIGEDVDGGIYSDLGETAASFRDFNISHQRFRENEIHKALPKYGKHKPWQLDVSTEYFEKLLRQGKNEEIVQEVEDKNWDPNLRGPLMDRSLIDMAAYTHNVDILEYLLENKEIQQSTLEKCMQRIVFHPGVIECLMKHGQSIDTLSGWGYTPLGHAIKSYISAFQRSLHYAEKDEGHKHMKDEMKLHEERIRFYVSVGADPEHVDRDGNDYKTVLTKTNSPNFLKKNNVISHVENIIYPNRPKKKKWRFW